jgi:hypothetical protein
MGVVVDPEGEGRERRGRERRGKVGKEERGKGAMVLMAKGREVGGVRRPRREESVAWGEGGREGGRLRQRRAGGFKRSLG